MVGEAFHFPSAHDMPLDSDSILTDIILSLWKVYPNHIILTIILIVKKGETNKQATKKKGPSGRRERMVKLL